MASSNFLPDRELELRTWTANFSKILIAQPLEFGITPEQAAHYQSVFATFNDLLKLTRSTTSNSSSNIVAKNDAKKVLIAESRALGRQIRGNANTTAAQLHTLGLTIPEDGPARLAIPATTPSVHIAKVETQTVWIRLRTSQSERPFARPRGVAGATIFTCVGQWPAAHERDWHFHGQTTRTKMKLDFPSDLPAGATVWIRACWINPRLQPGKLSHAVYANLPGQLSSPKQGLKIAA